MTIDVPDELVRRAREEAARQGVGLDRWVEGSLDRALQGDEPLVATTAHAFAEANREIWDNPEEDAAWAAW